MKNGESIFERAKELCAEGMEPKKAKAQAERETYQARRENWGEADEKRLTAYAVKHGIDVADRDGYLKAMNAVVTDGDLPENDIEADPVVNYCRAKGLNHENWAHYKRACGEVYRFDENTGGLRLRSQFSHYAKKGATS
jgi:hypothetical protein